MAVFGKLEMGFEKVSASYILTALYRKFRLMLKWFCCIFTNPLIPIGVTRPVLNDGLHRRKDG
jgi:hypothetical protein